MFQSYFELHFVWAFIVASLLLLTGVAFGFKKSFGIATLLLALSALVLAIAAAAFDPYLHLWDEAFHAVVAKNLMAHPLKPTLYEFHAIKLGTPSWVGDHVWLHKQPLFLWQIAASFSLFGVNEFALRLPSALLYVLLIPIVYRTGYLLHSKHVGFVAAVFMTTLSYSYQLISGAFMIDHNDVSFLFYVSLGIWAMLEYVRKPSWKWAVLMGAAVGCAVLVKWLSAFIVFFGWVLWVVLSKKISRSTFLHGLAALGICLLVFIPWQLFAYVNYTDVFLREMALNSSHFWDVIEGHEEPWYYYVKNLYNLYGLVAVLLILVPFGAFWKSGHNREVRFVLFAMIAGVFLFFSLAATKMPSFTFMISVPIFLLVSVALVEIYGVAQVRFSQSGWVKTGACLCLFLVGLININFENLQRYHTTWKKPQSEWRTSDLYKKAIFSGFAENHKAPTVLFNLKDFDSVYLMFYSRSIGYNFIPSIEDLENTLKNYPVVVIENGTHPLPDYILNHPEVEILKNFY